MADFINDILQEYPSPSINNSRSIVREKLLRMRNNPNDRTAQELDALGFSVDWDDYRDHDEPDTE